MAVSSNSIQDSRPTFFFKNKKFLQVRAAGVLPYIKTDDGVELLMIRYNRKFEDFGGKTDMLDTSVKETAVRETVEESNGVLTKKMLSDKINNRTLQAYSKHSKYLLYFVPVQEYYDPQIFGNIEKHENIIRTVEWVPVHKLKDPKFIEKYLHIRLRFSYFNNCLEKL